MTYENSFTGSIRPYQIQRKHAGAEPTRTTNTTITIM